MSMITETIGEPAVYEQLAEEAAELAKAALKIARLLRNENPTPVKYKDGMDNLLEEVTDVLVCLYELELYPVDRIFHEKMERWIERIKAQRGALCCNLKQ